MSNHGSGRTRPRLLVLGLALLLTLALAGPATADPTSIPNGPCAPPAEGEPNRTSTLSYDEIEAQLLHLEQRSRGQLSVDEVGTSGEGRPLYTATIGEGDTRVWIQGRIHGNEPYGAEASLELLKRLVAGQGASDVLDEVTFMVIPIYNPDGSEAYHRADVVEGIDLNRDWIAFQAAESRAFWYAWEEFRPHYAIDIHHQGMGFQGAYRVGDTDKLSTFSLGISLGPWTMSADRYAELQQMTAAAAEAAGQRGNVHPTRYPFINIAEGVISAMILGSPGPEGEDPEWQTSAIFFETRGGVEQKSRGYLIGQNVDALWGVIGALVDDDLDSYDSEGWNALPPRSSPYNCQNEFPERQPGH